jgi:hypothetical protein
MMLFREEQRFRQKRQRWMLAIPPLALSVIAFVQVVLHHPFGLHPMSNGGILGLAVFLWLVYLRLATVRLVTEVTDRALSVGFRGLWRKRRIPIRAIASARAVTYDAARDYGGYGIRSSSRGRAYIVSGNRGVRVQLADGSGLLVGSAASEELARAIARARSESEAS